MLLNNLLSHSLRAQTVNLDIYRLKISLHPQTLLKTM